MEYYAGRAREVELRVPAPNNLPDAMTQTRQGNKQNVCNCFHCSFFLESCMYLYLLVNAHDASARIHNKTFMVVSFGETAGNERRKENFYC